MSSGYRGGLFWSIVSRASECALLGDGLREGNAMKSWLRRHATAMIAVCAACGVGVACNAFSAGDQSIVPVTPQLERAQVEHGPRDRARHLGTVRFPSSCSPSVQGELERAVALLHHMTYRAAEAAFAEVAQNDPRCAMAHWGIAMTLFHPGRPGPPDVPALARGRGEIDQARSLASMTATAQERAFIDATAGLYYRVEQLDHRARLRAFEAGMSHAHQRFPDDIEAAAFHALGLLATIDPADQTYVKQRQAGRIAEQIAVREPDHPGALRYLIHAYDTPGLAHLAVDPARRYFRIAPADPEALHVPSHIFTRVGLWQDSIAVNLRSAEVAQKLDIGGPMSMHYAHALDFGTYAYLQGAEDGRARVLVTRAASVTQPWQDDFTTAYALAAVPARYHLERHAWKEASRLEPRQPRAFPWDRYPAAEAITHFARAMGCVRARDPDIEGAATAARQLTALHERIASSASRVSGDYWAARVDIQRRTANAWVSWARGNDDEALTAMRGAADAESAVERDPITPGEVLLARELLGDLLVELGRPAEALAEYTRVLERTPKRFNSVAGAARAAELVGDASIARGYHEQLLETCARADADRPELARARTVVGARESRLR
jgi:tetratricopeptide (TPR) repeat protein